MKKAGFILCLQIIIILFSGCAGNGTSDFLSEKTGEKGATVTIAVMQDPNVESFNRNYYTQWLEKKTGYDIEFVYFTKGYEEEYLKAMLEVSGEGTVDAVFLPETEELISKDTFQEYIDEGYICELSQFADAADNITAITSGVSGSISASDTLNSEGQFYFIPRINNSKKRNNSGVLWINSGWLEALGLRIPETYSELENVLSCFYGMDPNNNGEADELPLITNISNEYLDFDVFVKKNNSGDISEAESFCNLLRSRGLLRDEAMNYSDRQLRELVNSSEDCVGAFVSQSISDVVYINCSDVIARYTPVPPLKNDDGEIYSAHSTARDQIGGYIPQNAVHKREAFEIMDLMLSEEASVIAVYGEKDVDYRQASEGELSAYGEKAVITTINILKNSIQSKNFDGAGPRNLPQEQSDNVKWDGDNYYSEYLDARAVRLYEQDN